MKAECLLSKVYEQVQRLKSVEGQWVSGGM